MVRIAYKLGLLQLANEKRWGPSHDLKLQNYVEALLAKGALGEVIQFVDGDGMKGYPRHPE